MPITPTAKLHKNWNTPEELEKSATRDGFGAGLLDAAKKHTDIVGLTADLGESTRMHLFAEKYPSRFIQVGVAEQNLVTVASGLAAGGKLPFAAGFGAFMPGRCWEQIRTTIAYNNQPVQLIGSHAGLSVGEDGATHQVLEDIALMRSLPNMRVIVPADAAQTRKAVLAMAKDPKPTYLRIAREKFSVVTTKDTPFVIGKADVYHRGADVTIIACGPQVHDALLAAFALKSEIAVEVINMHTIKPIDVATIVKSVAKTGAVVTVEDHQIAGGLGGAVAEVLAAHHPAPIEFVGVQDQFGESGTAKELLEHFGLTVEDIIAAVRKAVSRKK